MLIIGYIPIYMIMKNFKNISSKLVLRICAVCVVSVMLSSCLKSHNDNTPTPPVSLLTVIQASPDQPPLDFYLNSDKVNSGSISYGNDIDYFRAYSGKRAAIFKLASGTNLILDSITLKQNFAYSLFLAGKASAPELVYLTDTLVTPAAGSAGVRFINLSPDAPAVDLAIKGGGAVWVGNKWFKGFSSFANVSGNKYSLEVRKAGTTTVLASVDNVSILPGYIYTIWLHGLVASTGASNALTIGVITNAVPY